MFAALIGGWELILILMLLGIIGFVVGGVILLAFWLGRKSHTVEKRKAEAALPPLSRMFKVNLEARRKVIIAVVLVGLIACLIILASGGFFVNIWR